MTIYALDLLVQKARQEGVEQFTRDEGELVLDFSSVARIDAGAVRALEELADAAAKTSVHVGLRGVNVGIYRALKLLNLSNRFSFLS